MNEKAKSALEKAIERAKIEAKQEVHTDMHNEALGWKYALVEWWRVRGTKGTLMRRVIRLKESPLYDTRAAAIEDLPEAIEWAELLFVTGTTLVNNTIGRFLGGKPVIFYGTTIAGAAHLMGWERYCEKGG